MSDFEYLQMPHSKSFQFALVSLFIELEVESFENKDLKNKDPLRV